MKKILFIQTAFLGDVVLGTSVIETLRKRYPSAQIDYLVRKGNEGLLDGNKAIDHVLILDKKNKYRSILQNIRHLRSQSYDWVINANRYFSAGVIAAFSGAKKTSGYAGSSFSFMLSQIYKHSFQDGRHEIHRLHDLIEEEHPSMPKLYVDEVVLPIELPDNYITIAPSSVWYTKRLPVPKWIELCDKSEGIPVFILGAPSDHGLAQEIIEGSHHTDMHNLCGKMSLLQSAKMIAHATMNYSNDSAPLHMASATDAPITGFYLSTASSLGYTPLSQIQNVMETHHNLSCRPCGTHGKTKCPHGHFKCADIQL